MTLTENKAKQRTRLPSRPAEQTAVGEAWQRTTMLHEQSPLGRGCPFAGNKPCAPLVHFTNSIKIELDIRLRLEINRKCLSINKEITADDTRRHPLRQDIQQRRLSSSGFAHQRRQLARSDVARHVVQQRPRLRAYLNRVTNVLPREFVRHRRWLSSRRFLQRLAAGVLIVAFLLL